MQQQQRPIPMAVVNNNQSASQTNAQTHVSSAPNIENRDTRFGPPGKFSILSNPFVDFKHH